MLATVRSREDHHDHCNDQRPAAIWYLMARDLYRITGIFGMSPPPYQAR